jgi:hypothetical protein
MKRRGVGGGEGELKLESWEVDLGLRDASSKRFANLEDESISVSISSSDALPEEGYCGSLSELGFKGR